MTELNPLTMLSLQAAGDSGWEHWTVLLSSEDLKHAQVMRSPVLVHLHQQKDTTKAPHARAWSSHSLHTATFSISLPKSPDQSPAAPEHPETLASAQVSLVHHPQWCRAAWSLCSPNRITPLLLQPHKATGTTPTPGLPCRPLPTSLGSLLSETKPRPLAPQGVKPVQVWDTAGSLLFPLSTTFLHNCVPLIHAKARNSHMSQMLCLCL